MDSDSSELSSSLSEWRVNLQKSWQNFMDSFITIRRRDETAVPLLAPNQDIYLRENIRSRLLVAAQAVPRHQEETYKQALDNVSTWIRAYYDTDDSATKAFLEEIDKLEQQSIAMAVPESLKSQPILEKLMQTRVRNLLAQPGVARIQMRPLKRLRENNHAESIITLCAVNRRDRVRSDDCGSSGLCAYPD
jgi:uroporphyrin-3 C-methyltransferase